MRKVYVLSLLLLTAASGAFAQRSIDWSVDEIITPVQLNSNASSGTSLATEFVLKNNGTDAVKVGDTILYQVSVSDLNNRVIVAYPNASSFAFIIATKDVNSGDTIHISRALNTTAYVKSSVNVRFNVISYVRNNGSDAITAEVAPGNANNLSQKAITWWNPQGWGVSVADVTVSDLVEVYPNPATDQVTIDWTITSGTEERHVKIYDMNGRLVMEDTATADVFTQSLNIQSLDAGMYMIEVSNGEYTSTKKLQVLK